MSPDADAAQGQPFPGAHARSVVRIRLKDEQFKLMTAVLGCESDATRAALIGVNEKTLRRARRGVIGEVFMARTVVTLRRFHDQLAKYGLKPSLDELFDVVEIHPPTARTADRDDLLEQVA